MMEDIDHDWVIEQYLHRVTGIETGPTLAAHDVEGLARVTTHGRWVYTDRLKLLGIEPLRFADIPHIRQGRRLSMNSAVSKDHAVEAGRADLHLPNAQYGDGRRDHGRHPVSLPQSSEEFYRQFALCLCGHAASDHIDGDGECKDARCVCLVFEEDDS